MPTNSILIFKCFYFLKPRYTCVLLSSGFLSIRWKRGVAALLNLVVDMFGCVNDSHLVFHNSFRHCRNNNLSWSVTKTSTFQWTQRSQPESPQREYFAATAAVSLLPAEVIYWTDLKTFVSINHLQTHILGPRFTLNRKSVIIHFVILMRNIFKRGGLESESKKMKFMQKTHQHSNNPNMKSNSLKCIFCIIWQNKNKTKNNNTHLILLSVTHCHI